MMESETNTVGFYVECLVGNSQHWQVRGFTPGAGSTTHPKQYTFVDDAESLRHEGLTLHYRLRQIDFDGRETISPVVEVTLDDHPMTFEIDAIYPNPARNEFQISLTLPEEQELDLTLFDALGCGVKDVRRGWFAGAGRRVFTVGTDDLPPGVYYLRATGRDKIAIRRLLIGK